VASEAKAPYRRHLRDSGGVEWLPADAGGVLTASEIEQVRALAADLVAKLEPVTGEDGRALPWDSEIGFVNGQLALLQVRPLKEKGAARANRVVGKLVPTGGPVSAEVNLAAPPDRGASAAIGAGRREGGRG